MNIFGGLNPVQIEFSPRLRCRWQRVGVREDESSGSRHDESFIASKALAAQCQCMAPRTSDKKRFQLLRGLIAIQERDGRKLSNGEVTLAIEEWHRLSQSVLNPEETLEHHLLRGLAELRKVKVALGKEVVSQAVEVVLRLPVSELPEIPGMPNAPENLRRIAALHLELSRRSTKKDKRYFLGCRDSAKAHPGLSKTEAAIINRALIQVGVIHPPRCFRFPVIDTGTLTPARPEFARRAEPHESRQVEQAHD